MYLFKREKKKDILKGRSIRYLTTTSIACSEVHLGNVLNGKKTCSFWLAKAITECAGNNLNIEDYFEKMEK